MNRRSFLGGIAAIVALTALGHEIIGTPEKRPPIHPDQIIEFENWLRAELSIAMARAIDLKIMFGTSSYDIS